MANKRNVEIFGIKAYKPQKSHILMALIMVAVGVGAFLFIGNQESSSITTRAVIPTPVEDSQIQQNPSQESTEEPIPVEEKEKEFYEYGGKCASDVKRAQDDVLDVNSYLSGYQSEYDSLKSEYEQKTADLQAQIDELNTRYTPDIERLIKKIEVAKQDLTRVNQQLEEVKSVCEF